MNHSRLHSALAKALASLVFLAPAASTAKEKASQTSFEDTFARNDSTRYEAGGGKWAYKSSRRSWIMTKALETENESMWALRKDVALPRAFTLEAEYTADDKDASVALAIKNPDTGDYACATLSLKKADEEGWWVTAWIVYSYPDEKWGYLQKSDKHVAKLSDASFKLKLTRPPGSNALEFTVANRDIGEIETSLTPETRGEEGKQLSPAWVKALDSLSRAGVFGYDCGGSWKHIKLTDLRK